ncbi:APC family permease [Lacipirellula parvula]|uniref:Putative amino acid permeas n=1 Tax=Lacipirellula parvula TaxID=2650471 RepID=A0A5K7XIM9_9BACT|nr:amino acid permease [Lacipirellula parvula]BBO34196.1 putative amino acid permeas [Lacipirellula parvula]
MTTIFIVVSSTIGTGVMTTSGLTVYFVGSNQLMLALWVIGGVLAMCGALTLCELSASLPRTGGDYVFLYEAYGPLAAFLSGWVSFLIGFGGPIAASAWAAAEYLLAPLGLDNATGVPQQAVASVMIISLGLVHCRGRSSAMLTQGAMTAVKIAILVAMAIAGLVAGRGGWENLVDRPPLTPSVLITMASSLVYISYAYTGWNAAAYVAGEVDRPQEQMPRAILIGTGLVIVLYLMLNTTYGLALSAVDVRAIVGTPDNIDAIAPIAQIAAERLYGQRIADWLSVAIGLTLLASVSAYILTGPRVIYAMACAGHFPAGAGKISTRGTPVIATVLQGAWSLILLWTTSFEWILLYSGVGLAAFSMLTVNAVYVLRRRRPDLPRPFKTPGYPLVPAVFLVGTTLLTGAVIYERPVISSISLLTIAFGVPVYYVWVAVARRYSDE